MSKLLRRSGNAVVEILGKHSWQPDAVFHVGLGMYHQELDVMKEQWSNVRYFAAEPHPDVFQSQGKGFDRIWEAAIGRTDSAGVLWAKDAHKDGSSMYRHNEEDHNKRPLTVPIRSLDSLLKENGPFGKQVLLWLDCEGSELDSLWGGKRFLQSVKAINVELTAERRGVGWCHPIEVHRTLRNLGFWPIIDHTIRCVIGQYDMLFLKKELVKDEYNCFPMEVWG